MKLKFKEDAELNIVTSYDEETDNIEEEINEIFKKDEIIDVDVIDDDSESQYFQLQFGDGSVIPSVQKSLFDVIEGD